MIVFNNAEEPAIHDWKLTYARLVNTISSAAWGLSLK
jgi:hypothetical protein